MALHHFRSTPAGTVALLGLAFGLAAIAACGNGDDNAAPVPGVDSGLRLGSVGDGSVASPCSDGGIEAGDATLSLYSVCSLYTGGCVPFDPARVPSHPQL